MGSVRFLLNFKKCFERKIALSLFEGALVVLLSLEGSALPAGSLVAQVVTTGPPRRYVLLLANCHHRHDPYAITVVVTCYSWTTNIMMHTHLLYLVPCALVLAAPNKPRIGPENEKDLEQVQAATTCQTAILRCCTPKTPTTDATWRCFEKNNCGGLFVVHEINDNNNNAEPSLGACAYLSKVKSMIEEVGNKESIDKETFEEELPKEELPIEEEIDTEISERNVGRPS